MRCETCNWYNITKDKKATEHSGKVHSQILAPGHEVSETTVYMGPDDNLRERIRV